ncbi:MAG: HEAT repeat domain-containing protein [Chloroflexi bacterium]|nr:MAG: HEAT repeat domain-containing protein [Chloroflexota bacterium]
MLKRAPGVRPLEPARLAIRRALVRRHLRIVAAGKSEVLKVELTDGEVDSSALLVEFAAPLDPASEPFQRVAHAMRRSGVADAVIDGLASHEPTIRARSARIAGAMRMEEVVPWLTPLLRSTVPAVRGSAARALGRIGGIRCADALLIAIQRIGQRPSLIVALARAAPDLYLEAILGGSELRAVYPAVAMAAGLRGRRTATAALILQLRGGSRRSRTASGRALGWLGAPAGIPELTLALKHPDWRDRMAAAKALGAIRAYRPGTELWACLTDRNPRVQRSARDALRKLSRR